MENSKNLKQTISYECFKYLFDTGFEKEFAKYREGLKEEMKEKFNISEEILDKLINYKELVKNLSPSKSVEKPSSESASSNGDIPNNEEYVKIFRKIFKKHELPYKEYEYDVETYEKALLLKNTEKGHAEKLKNLGGKWNPKLQGWIFSKKSLKEKK